jgi:hypothetical protein
MPKSIRLDRQATTRKSSSIISSTPHVRAKPRWDRTARKLYLGRCLVKEFPRLSTCQVLILEAFEEQGWPEAIDDPLPVEHDISPKRRLHDVIKRLNRNQVCPVLSFHGNGNGEGVVCKVLPKPPTCAPNATPMRPQNGPNAPVDKPIK